MKTELGLSLCWARDVKTLHELRNLHKADIRVMGHRKHDPLFVENILFSLKQVSHNKSTLGILCSAYRHTNERTYLDLMYRRWTGTCLAHYDTDEGVLQIPPDLWKKN